MVTAASRPTSFSLSGKTSHEPDGHGRPTPRTTPNLSCSYRGRITTESGSKCGPGLVGMTVTEHTALMSARLVSSGAADQFCGACGPIRSARSGSSSQAGCFGADPTSNSAFAAGGGGAGFGWPGRLLLPVLADRGKYVGSLQPVGEVVLDPFVDGSFFPFHFQALGAGVRRCLPPAVAGNPSLPGDQWFAASAALGDSGEQVPRDVAGGGVAGSIGQKGHHPVVGVGAVDRCPATVADDLATMDPASGVALAEKNLSQGGGLPWFAAWGGSADVVELGGRAAQAPSGQQQPRRVPDHFGLLRVELVVGAGPFPVLVPFNCSAVSEGSGRVWFSALGAVLELALHPPGPRLGAFGRSEQVPLPAVVSPSGVARAIAGPATATAESRSRSTGMSLSIGSSSGRRSGRVKDRAVPVLIPGTDRTRRVAWAGTSVIRRFTAGTSRTSSSSWRSARCSAELRGCGAFAAPAEVAVGAPVWVASVAAEVGAGRLVTVVTVVAALNEQLTPR